MPISGEKQVLVTGGAGYIGSHMVMQLLRAGRMVCVIDDLSTGHAESIDRLQREFPRERLRFVRGSILDGDLVTRVLQDGGIDEVLHFAGRALVGESMERPLEYWQVNLGGTISLLRAMHSAGATRLVFSSTCATYGSPSAASIPIGESCDQRPINPYGASKLACERAILDDAAAPGSTLAVAILRYFNVIGSDPRGFVGEDHTPETHIVPACLRAASGAADEFVMMGTDYSTPDGTCIRDYVNVNDLCEAHMAALGAVVRGAPLTLNVGTGRGHSVRDIVEACERVVGRAIPQRMGARRAGDPPTLVADPARITSTLPWRARTVALDESVAQTWRWMQANPRGYATDARSNL